MSEYVQVKIHAENAYYTVEETYSYRVFNLIDGYFNVVNLNPKLYTDYDLWIWSWNVGANGHYHQNYTFQEGNLLIDTTNYAGFVIVIYEKGHEIPNMNKWDNSCVTQSVDISGKLLRKGYFDAGSLKV